MPSHLLVNVAPIVRMSDMETYRIYEVDDDGVVVIGSASPFSDKLLKLTIEWIDADKVREDGPDSLYNDPDYIIL